MHEVSTLRLILALTFVVAAIVVLLLLAMGLTVWAYGQRALAPQSGSTGNDERMDGPALAVSCRTGGDRRAGAGTPADPSVAGSLYPTSSAGLVGERNDDYAQWAEWHR